MHTWGKGFQAAGPARAEALGVQRAQDLRRERERAWILFGQRQWRLGGLACPCRERNRQGRAACAGHAWVL